MHERLGEEQFRKEEFEVIKNITMTSPCVIALGGGSFTLFQTQELLPQYGRIIYLFLPLSMLLEKLQKQLMQDICPTYLDPEDPIDSYKKIFQRRHQVFRRLAFLTIEVVGISREEVVNKICNLRNS